MPIYKWSSIACPCCGSTNRPARIWSRLLYPDEESGLPDVKMGRARRYECNDCGHRFYTHQPAEVVISPYQLQWRKKNKQTFIRSIKQ